MRATIRRPEEILAYRSLIEILGPSPRKIWSVTPSDSVRVTAQLMAENDIGFVVVTDNEKLVGVLSERDCVRHMGKSGQSLEIPVAQIMVRDVVTVGLQSTFADCLRLMHTHRIRHLPVMQGTRVMAVISVRDLLGEATEHHKKIIDELERERLSIFTSMA
jgi:signal-transduction protein with cAMP-binding, CBS, and nucleotidyltransferase domain